MWKMLELGNFSSFSFSNKTEPWHLQGAFLDYEGTDNSSDNFCNFIKADLTVAMSWKMLDYHGQINHY